VPEYLSSFTSGFEPLIAEALPALLPGVKNARITEGLAAYSYGGAVNAVHSAGIFNNTFIALARLPGMDFHSMIKAIVKGHAIDVKHYVKPQSRYRVRFQQNGRFVQVPAASLALAESVAAQRTRLAIDRARPDIEFWYIRRADGSGYYALLTQMRARTEKASQPGELKPELARLLCLLAGVKGGCTVLDPFAGYGSIAGQAATLNGNARVYACDIDQGMADHLKRRFRHMGARIDIRRADARSLGFIGDGIIDHIITDPPWAEYDRSINEVEALYRASLQECSRVLKPGGVLTLVTSKKAEAERAAHAAGFILNKKLDILVSGKKAGAYKFINP
jgi:23S rRNA G2445 N2-methylase RlmL